MPKSDEGKGEIARGFPVRLENLIGSIRIQIDELNPW